jgi:hypothetical protein
VNPAPRPEPIRATQRRAKRRYTPPRLATVVERLGTKSRIESYRTLNAKNGNVVEALFGEAKAAFAASRDRLSALDAKAATLIGIVTTGFGAIALLGDPSHSPSRGVWMAVALIALATGFFLALASMAPQPAPYPALSNYNLLETVTNPANEARVKFEITEAWMRDTNENLLKAHQKGQLLLASIVALVVALSSLGVNYIVAKEKPEAAVRVIFGTPQPVPSTR